ncbi:hypothetical protein AMTRI_Chr06g178820 [Amborella trichopoda]
MFDIQHHHHQPQPQRRRRDDTATAMMAAAPSSSSSSSSVPCNSPCAACKFLRRKCTPECVFAPYFPPDQPQKFANVHKVFGASNVTKLLNDLHPAQREDAVNSLAYEAEARLRDPVYGCVGVISMLQIQLKQLQGDLVRARAELSKYINAGLAAAVAQQQHLQQHGLVGLRGAVYDGHNGGYEGGIVAVGMGGGGGGLGPLNQFGGGVGRGEERGGGDGVGAGLGGGS